MKNRVDVVREAIGLVELAESESGVDSNVYHRNIRHLRSERDALVKFGEPVPSDALLAEAAVALGELTRSERIAQAVAAYAGPTTVDGKPRLRELRQQSGIPDISVAERDEAVAG